MIATLLIGLREGLEAALVVGVLLAYVKKLDRPDAARKIWFGIAAALLLSLAIGAILTFGAYGLSFTAQEVIGGTLSIVAVAMVTWMVFWMLKMSRGMSGELRGQVDRALIGGGWGVATVAFVSIAREGIETTLLLWSMVQSFGDTPSTLLGALLGLAAAVVLGWLLARGMVRVDLRVFFAWTGAFLVVVAAGVLAYAIHDLQEAGALPGPFTALAPIDATGAVATGWAAFPFGWAFDLRAAIPPTSPLAALLQATIGFMPQMTWLQVIAWVLYLAVVGTIFVRGLRRRPTTTVRRQPAAQPDPSIPHPQGAS